MKVTGYLALACAAAGLAGTASIGNAAIPVGISGKVVLPLTLNFTTYPVTTFTNSYSSIHCTLTLTSDDAFIKEDSVTVTAKISGKSATCDLTMDYLWHVENAKSHMTVAYAITAIGITSTGSQAVERLASGTLDKIVLPASGKVTTYKTVALTL